MKPMRGIVTTMKIQNCDATTKWVALPFSDEGEVDIRLELKIVF